MKLVISELSDNDINDIVKRIKLFSEVYDAVPNYFVPIETQNANMQNFQRTSTTNNSWAFDRIQLDAAYEILPNNCEKVNVGIFDSGIYIDELYNGSYKYHEDFDGIDIVLRNYVSSQCGMAVDNDKEGHGTFISSIIAAKRNNGKGLDGVYNNLSIYMYKLYDYKYTSVVDYVRSDRLINAINDAVADNIKILNISLGFDFDLIMDNYGDDILCIAQSFANFPGLIICAAGNDSEDIDVSNNAIYPATYDFYNIITVGALGENNLKWTGSNYGDNYVDLFAPGENIYGATIPIALNNYSIYNTANGTSYATAYVPGVAAILLSINTQLTPCMLKQIILSTVTNNSNLENYCITGGTLNAYNAVSYLLSINEEIVLNNTTHIYYSIDYYNDTYHICRCLCNNLFYEEHEWILVSTLALNPQPIRMSCKKCGVEKF